MKTPITDLTVVMIGLIVGACAMLLCSCSILPEEVRNETWPIEMATGDHYVSPWKHRETKQERLQRTYSEGWNDGFLRGYEEGKDVSWLDGYNEGYKAAKGGVE